jgi:hypothetical protein
MSTAGYDVVIMAVTPGSARSGARDCLAMKFSIRASELHEQIYAYPTFASDIKHMLGHIEPYSPPLSTQQPTGISRNKSFARC